jgi:hypothetical protein
MSIKQHVRDMGPITDGEYISFQNDVNYAINTLGKVKMDIYLDASGNTYAPDSSGNLIENRLLTRLVYTYPHLDELTQQPVEGYFQITFEDGTYWGNNDANNSAYWYYIIGILPKVIYQFT